MPDRKRKKKTTKLKDIENKITIALEDFQKARNGIRCYPLFLNNTSIGYQLVDNTYEELQSKFSDCEGKLDVFVHSSGGDIDSTYNLGQLFRRFGIEELNFIVPRWAKSAATLLVCAGDRILMTPVAELGPLDPQITAINPLDRRIETFSPLHIDSTLQLIRDEFSKNKDLAEALIQRLQFPLTLGSFRKSLEIAKQYLKRFLVSRMLKKKEDCEILANKICETLTEGYADHGFCINCEEAKNIGLVAEEITNSQLTIAWNIHKLNMKRADILKQQREKEIRQKIKDLPPGILEKLPKELQPLVTDGETNV